MHEKKRVRVVPTFSDTYTLLTSWLAVVLTLTLLMSGGHKVQGQEGDSEEAQKGIVASPTVPAANTILQEIVCPTTDVRNDPHMFLKLTNCTVIEGHLQILLIDYAKSSEYENLHFPMLREITDYLLLYRVYGLRTLAHIFPNLSVIRGQKLFFNYALVADEMPDMEELGLPALTTIERGAIRLEKNPNLCYIDTIDWDSITRRRTDDNIIIQNKDVDECPDVCPSTPQCPYIEVDEGRIQQLCWNSESCQVVCDKKCSGGCYQRVNRGREEAQCCHPECHGGCHGPANTQCTACKHVRYNGRCQKQCLYGTYKFLNRRCITETECREMKVIGARHDMKQQQWKIVKAEDGDEGTGDGAIPGSGGGGGLLCEEECPNGYIKDSYDPHKCVKCHGPCPKRCGGITIDSVAAAQKLKGCTIIHGILEIQIRGGSQGQIGRELEENLSQLEEVTHYVKIVRSYASVSLRFLNSLKVIHGDRLHNDRYAFFVLDNQNLIDIWNFTAHPPLTIKKGKMFFMFNRKLCLDKIHQLVKFVGLENVTTDEDIDPNTNGDQVACETSQLTLEVLTISHNYAVIRWNNFHTPDHRELLSWVVYYREAPQQNITIFNARDACGNDGWKTDDVNPDMDTNATFVASILHDLKPATQYAIYVQTYTVARAKSGAISHMQYLTTKPDVPSPAWDVKVTTKITGEMHVTWRPPSNPNGNVTHYHVYWQPQVLNIDKFDKRNYCIDKLRLPNTRGKVTEVNPKNSSLSGDCCACPKSKEEVRQEEEERLLQIEFENFLQNAVYIKRYPLGKDSSSGRKRRETEPTAAEQHLLPNYNNSIYNLLGNYSLYMNLTDPSGGNATAPGATINGKNPSNIPRTDNPPKATAPAHVPYEEAIVYGALEVTLSNLRHFQEYSVEVIACHNIRPGEREKLCSNRAITTSRTLPNMDADNIPEMNITVYNHSNTRRIWLKWLEPPEPNGIIITFDIELLKTDVANYKADIFCLPHKEYREHYGYLTEPLNPGNWSFRMRAMSLAGNGSWTPTMFFYVADFDEGNNMPLGLMIGLPVTIIVLLALIATIMFMVYYAKKKTELPPSLLYTSVNPEYWSGSEVYVQDHWEVERDKIEKVRELGQGSFGMVYEGVARNLLPDVDEVKVAIKTVNEKASLRDRIEFLNEASVMKAFSCYHVVRLLGVVSKGQPTLVVMELMSNGDLKSYLRMHRPDCEENDGRKPPSLKTILHVAGEIADGMAYLAAKKFVHRDLAARNCMVSEAGVVKIGDFGMTRDIYETDYYRKGDKGLLPVRWMAPESLRDGVFTSQSDVWSYGVVLWEMATLAHQPYQGLSNEQVLKYVIDGGLMEKPEGCPLRLDNLMMLCWQMSPKKRPTFCEIIEMLLPDLNPNFKDVSFFFSEENHIPTYCDMGGESVAADEELSSEGGGGQGDGEEDAHSDIHTPLTLSPAPSPQHHHHPRHPPPPHYHQNNHHPNNHKGSLYTSPNNSSSVSLELIPTTQSSPPWLEGGEEENGGDVIGGGRGGGDEGNDDETEKMALKPVKYGGETNGFPGGENEKSDEKISLTDARRKWFTQQNGGGGVQDGDDYGMEVKKGANGYANGHVTQIPNC